MNIIINVDDFGFSQSVNDAVSELVKLGSISSTTVMVNMPYWRQIANFLEYPDFGIGLHFNLTQGEPISSPEKIPSLLNKNGEFYSFKEFRKRSKNNKINKDEILIELQNQYNLLYSVVGNRLTHIDSHQAIHKYSPVSQAVYLFGSSNSQKSIGLRSPRHYFIHKSKLVKPTIFNLNLFGIKRFLTETYYNSYQKKFSKHFVMPDGELLDIGLKKTTTFRNLNNLVIDKNIIIEIPCHPATTIADLPPSKLTDKRVEEYQILKSKDFIETLKNFQLTNFRKI